MYYVEVERSGMLLNVAGARETGGTDPSLCMPVQFVPLAVCLIATVGTGSLQSRQITAS